MKFVIGAAALALAGPAFAQSTVSIYGIADLGGQVLSGHARAVREISGGLAGSRLGFKGSEDIGGGLHADFVLEGGLNLDEGGSAQGGALFGRQAYGALRLPAGTFSAGRQYSSVWILTSDFSAFSNTPVGPSTATLGGFAGGYEPVRGSGTTGAQPASGTSINGGPARVNNSLRYTTPDFGGLRASVLYGAGEVTGGTRGTRLVDGSLRFKAGGLDAMLSYIDDTAAAPLAANSANVATATAGIKWGPGDWHVEAGYMAVDDRRAANLDGTGFWAGGDCRFGPHLLRAQFIQNRPLHAAAGKTNALGAGYQFDFSVRTAMYTSLTRFQNSGGGLGRANAAIAAGLTVAGDTDLSEFVLGVRHSF